MLEDAPCDWTLRDKSKEFFLAVAETVEVKECFEIPSQMKPLKFQSSTY
jgi:hypothetical protein